MMTTAASPILSIGFVQYGMVIESNEAGGPARSVLRVGIGGPVGSGKTALTLALCRTLRDRYQIAVVTNDIYTEEDAKFLVTHEALTADRIIGVETGGGPPTPHTEKATHKLPAISRP